MKKQQQEKQQFFLKLGVLLSLLFFKAVVPVFAEFDEEGLPLVEGMPEPGLQIQNDQLDIDGLKDPTIELRKNRRKKQMNFLREKRANNDKLIDFLEEKRSEREKAAREKEDRLMKKTLIRSMRGDFEPKQRVAAAPAPAVVGPAPVRKEEEEEFLYKNKVLPYAGIRQYIGNGADYDSKLNAGVAVDIVLDEDGHFSLGLVGGYSLMDINNYQNPYYAYGPSYYSGYRSYSPYNNYGAYSYPQGGDQVSANILDLGVNTKYFLLRRSRIRPFFGLGANYNRLTLEYTERRAAYSPYSYGQGDVGTVSGAYITGGLLLGAEIYISREVALNLDFQYSFPVTSAFDDDKDVNYGYYRNYSGGNLGADMARASLRNLGSRLEGADVAKMNLGFVIVF